LFFINFVKTFSTRQIQVSCLILKMKKQHLFCFLFLIFSGFIFAQNHTISGFISNSKNGETLIRATVLENNSKHGSTSNSYGFYSITIPMGFDYN